MLLPRKLRRRRGRPDHLRQRHRGTRQGRRQHRLVRGAGVRLLDRRGLSSTPISPRRFSARATPCVAWGPVGPTVKATAVDGGYRSTGTWSYASGSRHAQWLGGHSPLVDADGKRCLGAGRQAGRTDHAVSEVEGHDPRRLAGDGPEGHRQRQLHGDRPVRAGALHLHARARLRAPRERPAVPLHHLSDLRLGLRRAWRSASRGRRSTPSCRWRPPRCRCSAPSRSATTRWCSPRSRSPRRSGNRRAPI